MGRWNKLELAGQRFGRLVAIEKTGTSSKLGSIIWRCLCDCGNEKITPGSDLKSGNVQSCGCIRRESPNNALPGDEGAFRALYQGYRGSAKNKGLEFTLTHEQFRKLTSANCFYCNSAPSREKQGSKKSKRPRYRFNGIDRKDNTKGYLVDNCLPCCTICNYLKKDIPFEIFVEHIKKMFQKLVDN